MNDNSKSWGGKIGEQLRAEAAEDCEDSGKTRQGCGAPSWQDRVHKRNIRPQVLQLNYHYFFLHDFYWFYLYQTHKTFSNPKWLFVDCTSDGLATTQEVPIFQVDHSTGQLQLKHKRPEQKDPFDKQLLKQLSPVQDKKLVLQPVSLCQQVMLVSQNLYKNKTNEYKQRKKRTH